MWSWVWGLGVGGYGAGTRAGTRAGVELGVAWSAELGEALAGWVGGRSHQLHFDLARKHLAR